MKVTVSRTGAAALAAALFLFPGSQAARAQAVDSLALHAPLDVKGRAVYNPGSKDFVVWLTWRDNPDAQSAFVSPPDTSAWAVELPHFEMTYPTLTGVYTGDIDRTLQFTAQRTGTVGTDSLLVTYFVRREEHFAGRVSLPPGYVPGTVMPVLFRDERDNSTVDFGLRIAFSAGKMETQGSFIVGLEDFEGFHIWRGVARDGSDLEIIGEISKEEAFKGRAATGGSFADSVYFYDIIPTLRASQPWISPFGSVDCLGTRIDLDLEPDEFFWFDCNGTNGYTYYYTVTTFDRGYSLQSSSQGLFKYDNCTSTKGTPYPCNSELKRVPLEVNPQSDLYNVYVVPNPVRMGTSRLTTDNYHNFPDGLVRFVNVPANCTIKIYTISGDLVWTNDHVDGSGNVEWDVRNLENEDVSSGVYIYRIERHGDDGDPAADLPGSAYGRIVVIR